MTDEKLMARINSLISWAESEYGEMHYDMIFELNNIMLLSQILYANDEIYVELELITPLKRSKSSYRHGVKQKNKIIDKIYKEALSHLNMAKNKEPKYNILENELWFLKQEILDDCLWNLENKNNDVVLEKLRIVEKSIKNIIDDFIKINDIKG